MKMSDFDYKKYSLQKLEDWVCDAISTADATPQEVYDTIVSAITEYHDHHKKGFEYTTELLSLLNSNNKKWDEWEENYYPEEYKGSTVSSVKPDKVKKWVLPVEETKIAETDETDYFVTFPDDLLEAADLKENDKVEWISQGDGSYLLKKVPKTYDDMIADGYTMTADGFWIKEN
jgi:bifunctional DNA-binding transcriptional regulator/antitoxin component of YhaV-PrlF toxin-antitoxin module